MMARKHSSRSGFTLVEVGISAAVFSLIILMGVTVSDSTVRSTSSSVRRGDRLQKAARSMEEFQREVASAGLSTLEATPSQGGSIPEPMLDDTNYDNFSFRRAVAYSGGEVVYEPAAPNPPCQVWFQPDPRRQDGVGDLLYFDGTRTHVWRPGVQAVVFVKKGSTVSLQLTPDGDDYGENQPGQIVRSVVFRAP